MTLFCAVDFETANRDSSSICQVGIAHFHNGTVIDSWMTLVDPETNFLASHMRIHGIGPDDVHGQPCFADIWPEFRDRTRDGPIASHTFFDRSALHGALDRSGLPTPVMPWIDSCQLVRQAWPEQQRRGGYGLKALATLLGIRFRHHDALEDAIVAGKIVLAACAELNGTIGALAVQSASATGVPQDWHPGRPSQ